MVVVFFLADEALEDIDVGRVLRKAIRVQDMCTRTAVHMIVSLYNGHTDSPALLSNIRVYRQFDTAEEVGFSLSK